MTEPLVIYGDLISGNCLKVKWVADHLGVAYEWRTVDVRAGQARDPVFLAVNPAGKVPAVALGDGRVLSESNAIILYLAEGSALIPGDSFDRARMFQWLFWEQYSHEPYVAVRRYRLAYLGEAADTLDPRLLERGREALLRLDRAVAESRFLVGERLSLADVALVAYTRMAGEGGFDLDEVPGVRRWIGEVEDALRIGPYDAAGGGGQAGKLSSLRPQPNPTLTGLLIQET